MRLSLYLVAALVLAASLSLAGCSGGNGPTSPSPIPAPPTASGGGTVTTAPSDTSPPPPAEAASSECIHSLSGLVATVDCRASSSPHGRAIHYFKSGPHPQKKLHVTTLDVAAGGIERFDGTPFVTEALTPSLSCEEEKEVKVDLQIDFTPKGNADRASDSLGTVFYFEFTSFSHLYTSEEKCPEECVPTFEKEETTEWGEVGACTPETGGQCFTTQEGATTTTVTNSCTNKTTTTIEDLFKKEPCECACVPEEANTTEEIIEGEWGECTPANASASFFASCREDECHQFRSRTKVITTTYTCDKPPTEERIELKPEHRACECPPPPVEEACYYTPDCRFGSGEIGASTACPNILKAAMCVAEGGQWSNWNGSSNQCKTSLPGIYKSNFRLVPGQSHPACLKFTGPN